MPSNHSAEAPRWVPQGFPLYAVQYRTVGDEGPVTYVGSPGVVVGWQILKVSDAIPVVVSLTDTRATACAWRWEPTDPSTSRVVGRVEVLTSEAATQNRLEWLRRCMAVGAPASTEYIDLVDRERKKAN